MRKTMMVAAGYGLVLVLAAAAVQPWDRAPAPLPDVELASALTPFDACDDALAYFTETAAAQAAAWQRDGGGGTFSRRVGDEQAMDLDANAAEVPAPAPAASAAREAVGGGAEEFSATNVQEAGVDEPDLVKTDGRRMVTLAGGRLHVLDVETATARVAGTLDLPGEAWGQELLLDGDRALVFTSGWSDSPVEPAATSPVPEGGPQSVLTLVDLAETATPRVTSTLTMDGEYVSARMVDGVARVVLRSHPGGPVMDMPTRGGPAGGTSTDVTLARSTIDDWVPSYRLEAEETVTDRVVDCERIHRPAEPAGTGMVTVLSVDLAGQLEPGAATSVVADAQTVYASTDTLYVAFSSWEQEATTQVHAFDLTDPTEAVYTASGDVPGRLLNQWSLSEHGGHLRVATTEGEALAGPAAAVEPAPGAAAPSAPAPAPSQSAVTVLAAQGDELVQVGRVEGLGPDERIYAVRFMGDVGYVVTFRETDPLYTLDLSDPADPRVLGELKILGYSAYLHPLGDDLLLGVGQDATEQGRTLGTQLSLFDVADLSNPTRIHQTTIADGHSTVEHDHRAFLHWPATGTIVLPVETWSLDEATGAEDVFSGAVAYTADRHAGFAEQGRLSHAPHVGEPWMAAIRRSLVVGEHLYTVSEVGVAVHDLATLAEQAWVPVGR